MDPRLLRYYNRELQHIREMGGEFAAEFPKIAGRLGLDGFECADPYVERLLEGFAFLAARVQLKIDSEFPRFTQHLLEVVCPHYLAPTPSMAVVQFQPTLAEGALAAGFPVPRGTVLHSLMGKDDQTPCDYRTAHDVTLWPLEVAKAEYFATAAAVTALELPEGQGARAAIRLRLRTTAGLTFNALALDSLPLFLRGADQLPMHLYEQILANAVGVVVRPATRPVPWQQVLDRSQIRRVGFEDGQALLPYGPRSFQGYRLLHEYFAFPDRYMFVELTGLGPAVRRCTGSEIELILLLDRSDAALDGKFDAGAFALFATPAINLFPKRTDRIHLTDRVHEHHVVPDHTRPMDFEVYEITSVFGHGTSAEAEQEFLPLYAINDLSRHPGHRAFYTVHRLPRVLSARQKRQGPRSKYAGSEIFLSLVDSEEAPLPHSLRQLSLTALCTNRDLPLQMPVGKGNTDFTMESGAPIDSVRILAGPTRPKPSFAGGAIRSGERSLETPPGEVAWRLISHLSLNYLSLLDDDRRQGAAALRDLLKLYGDASDSPTIQKQIEGVRSVGSKSIIRRVSTDDRLAFGRGVEVTVTCDESAFEGTGIFLLGAVLDQFFAKYVSINSFTQTVLRSTERGEVMRWPVRIGRRHTL